MADLRSPSTSHQPTGRPGISPCASHPNQEILPRFSRPSPTLISSRPVHPAFQFQRSSIFLSSNARVETARKPKIKKRAVTGNGRDLQSPHRAGDAVVQRFYFLAMPRNGKEINRMASRVEFRVSYRPIHSLRAPVITGRPRSTNALSASV